MEYKLILQNKTKAHLRRMALRAYLVYVQLRIEVRP